MVEICSQNSFDEKNFKLIKCVFSEKATKIEEIFSVDLTLTT